MSNIHFIICNYNAQSKQRSLEKSLLELKRLKSDGVYFHMVDNMSKDDSPDILCEYRKDRILDNVFLSSVNKGKAFALNRIYEFIDKSYTIEDDDVIVSMDSDIIIRENDFIDEIRRIFQYSNAGYAGFIMFEDDACNVKSNYTNQSVYEKSYRIADRDYMVINKQSGLAGGILAVRNRLYKNIRYNEHLGRNGQAAIYGGDDAVLTLNLFRSGHPGVYDPECRIVHYPHDKKYAEWKEDVIQNMIHNGFGNSTIPEKGFYD